MLLGRGKPLELTIGDQGPSLGVGDTCQALDIRMTWCDAELVGTRVAPSGRVEYRMHYVGWKKYARPPPPRVTTRLHLCRASLQRLSPHAGSEAAPYGVRCH